MNDLKLFQDNMLPFASHLGIACMPVRAEFSTRPDVFHGSAIMAFADTLGGCASTAMRHTAIAGGGAIHSINIGHCG